MNEIARVLVMLELKPLASGDYPLISDEGLQRLERFFSNIRSDNVAEQVSESRELFDIYSLAATEFLRADKPLPPPVKAFTLGVLNGEIRRQRPGQRKGSHLHRNTAIVTAVRAARKAAPEMETTRNESASPTSACDLVRDCLEEFGIHMSYKAVEKIWNHRPRLPDD